MGAKSKRKPPRRYASLRHRILANIKREPPPSWTGLTSLCWIWQGAKNARGYGHMSVRKPRYNADAERDGTKVGKVLVHRIVLKEFFGIPLELVEASMHKCSTKPCCNPDHVDPGTNQENTQHYYTVERTMRLAIEAAGGGAVQPDREPGCDDE